MKITELIEGLVRMRDGRGGGELELEVSYCPHVVMEVRGIVLARRGGKLEVWLTDSEVEEGEVWGEKEIKRCPPIIGCLTSHS